MTLTALLTGLLAVGVLAGCGGSGTTAPAAAPAPGPSTAPSTAPTTASRSAVGTTAPAAGGAAGSTSRSVGSQAPAPVESNPAGDIPDTVGFVVFSGPAGAFELKHPEGWVQSSTTSGASFTDKLSSITLSVGAASGPPTPDSFRSGELAALQAAQPAFALTSVAATTLPAGSGVLVRYLRNSPPDPVTTRQHRDEVLRYEVVGGGRRAVLELADPVGADNVDAFRTVAQSLRLR